MNRFSHLSSYPGHPKHNVQRTKKKNMANATFLRVFMHAAFLRSAIELPVSQATTSVGRCGKRLPFYSLDLSALDVAPRPQNDAPCGLGEWVSLMSEASALNNNWQVRGRCWLQKESLLGTRAELSRLHQTRWEPILGNELQPLTSDPSLSSTLQHGVPFSLLFPQNYPCPPTGRAALLPQDVYQPTLLSRVRS